jgi:hypothetical protein
MMKMVMHSENIPAQLKRLCASQMKPNDSWSRLVLPSESYNRQWVPGWPDLDEVQEDVKGAFWPHIIGCVSYQVLGDESIHQTAFVYGISRGAGDFAGFLSQEDGPTSKDELCIEVQTGGFAT